MMQGQTCWVLVKDLTNNIMYFRGQTFLGIRKMEMSKTSDVESMSVVLDDDFEAGVEDVTDKMHNYGAKGGEHKNYQRKPRVVNN